MNVMTTKLPAHSALLERVQNKDFIDCYSVPSTLSPRQAAEIITDFPLWGRLLIAIRNGLTRPFGLLKEGAIAGDKVGFFPVESESKDELIAGFDDKHLNFRVAVVSYQAHIYLATWVHPHHIGGTLYLNAILPFHKLIARDALARVQKHERG